MSKDHQIVVTTDQLFVIADALKEYYQIRLRKMSCVAKQLGMFGVICRDDGTPYPDDYLDRLDRCTQHLHQAYVEAIPGQVQTMDPDQIAEVYPVRAAFAMEAAITCELGNHRERIDEPLDLRPIGGRPDEQ